MAETNSGEVITEQHWWEKDYGQRLVVWLLFGCLASLLPLVIEFVKAIDTAEGPSFSRIFGSGELLIISAVLAAGTLGEVIHTMPRSLLKTILVFSCGAELLLPSLWFADLRGKIGVEQISVVNGETKV